MTNKELKKIEREGARKLNKGIRTHRQRMTYQQLRKAWGYRLANAETRRLVRAEAKRRGYKLSAFGG